MKHFFLKTNIADEYSDVSKCVKFFLTRDVRTSDIPSKMNKKLAFPVNHHV